MSVNSEVPPNSSVESIGDRLRRAREDRGMTQQAAAAALKLPVTVIESLETEQFERLGATVYAVGHLRAYLRWLGLPEVLASSVGQRLPSAPPELRSTSHVSHFRFLLDRYASRAVYVVLTLSIIVPALWVATQTPRPQAPLATRSLEQAVTPAAPGQVELPAPATPSVADSALTEPAEPVAANAAEDGDQTTVLASLAPFYPSQASTAAATESVDDAATDTGWTFTFSDKSWVEIRARDGRRLEYGLVPAGQVLHFDSAQLARVALGNADAVTLARNGEPVTFAEFKRANVARFAVSSDGSLSADSQ